MIDVLTLEVGTELRRVEEKERVRVSIKERIHDDTHSQMRSPLLLPPF